MPDAGARLLAVAHVLFATRGYHAVPVAELLSSAGAVVGSLYHHFESKEGLYRAVLEHAEGDWSAALVPRLVRDHPDPLGRVVALLESHAPGSPTAWHAALLRRAGVDAAGLPGWAGEIVRRAGLERRGTVRSWLEAGRARLPHDADPDATASMVLLMIDGVAACGSGAAAAHADACGELRRYFDLLEERAAVG